MPPLSKKHPALNFRVSRPVYWMLVALVAALQIGIMVMDPGSANYTCLFVWVMVYTWRLHDFNKSGWWAVAVVLTCAMAPILALGAATNMRLAIVGVSFLLQTVFTIGIGIPRPDPMPNGRKYLYKPKARPADVF